MKVNHCIALTAFTLTSTFVMAEEGLIANEATSTSESEATIESEVTASTGMLTLNRAISEHAVLTAQQTWCDALVSISATYGREGHAAAKALAEMVIDAAYGHKLGGVLFKPTLTVNPQTFRTTREGALSYFMGGNPAFPDDSGFALKGWTQCKVDNAGILITGDSAITMGKVHLTNQDGSAVSVDKTWGFVKDDAGALRIVVHHSSLEHQSN